MTIQDAINHPFATKNGELPPVEISVPSNQESQA